MSKHLLAFLLTVLAILLVSIAKSQAQSASISAPQSETKKSSALSDMNISLDLSQANNLENQSSADSVSSTSLVTSMSSSINKNINLFAVQSISRNVSDITETSLSNTQVGLSYKAFRLTNNTKLTPSTKIFLPTNKEDRESDSLRGAAAIKLALSSEQNIGIPVSLGASTELLKNAHEFESKANNTANLSFRLRTVGTAGFSFTDSIKLQLAAFYDTGRTYQNALRSGFYFSQEIGFKLNKSTSMYIAHENSGDPREANGTDIEIRAFNERSSVISGGIRTQF